MSETLPDGASLVLPGADGSAVAPLHLLYLKRTVRLFLQRAGELPGLPPASRTELAARVREALSKDARAVLACFASPTVGTPVHAFEGRAAHPAFRVRIEKAFADSAAHLLLELAARGLLAGPVDWPAAPRLLSPALGAAIAPPEDARGWRFESGVLTSLGESGPGASLRLGAQSLLRGRPSVRGLRAELAYVPLDGRVRLALADGNPLADLEAHPEKSGSALDLGGRSEDDWREAYQTALQWIGERMPDLRREMELLLAQIVPVGWHQERHFSASYRESIGTVYATLHPNPVTLAEAVIHEFQHNKANLASFEDPLLHNAFHPLYKSPVRPDPRPLWGILLAVHAFLPVAAFYRALRDAGHPASKTPDFARRLDDVDLKNHEGMAVLREHARFTAFGRRLMDGLEALDERHMAERRTRGLELVPTQAHPG